MKVAVYHNNNDIRLEERTVPQIENGEILVKMKASGICGTDVMEWYRIKKAPRVLGHELAGEVAESKSDAFKKGERVFVSHHVPCNQCKYCLNNNHTACQTLHTGNYDPGGYSEYIRVPRINVERGTYVLPDAVSYEEGTMIEPLGCAIRGQRVVDVEKGHTVLVLGSGLSGLLNIRLAKLQGATVWATDINEYRLEKAKEFGADVVINAKEDAMIRNVAADRIIVCTGAPAAAAQAFEHIDRKGIILFFAVPRETINVPAVEFWRDEITMTSSYGAAPVDLEQALGLIENGKVNVQAMMTHRLPLSEIQKGFQITAAAGKSLKVILQPDSF